jgi:predicted Zn-dependent protease with MMP-like domain
MRRGEFEKLVIKAIRELPDEFKDKLQNVDVVIEESIGADVMRRPGLGGRGRLLGLYQGIPLKDRTHYYGLVMPDKITLYKRNIERSCEERGLGVYEEVKHVIQHEIAHHFGISDKRLRDTGLY